MRVTGFASPSLRRLQGCVASSVDLWAAVLRGLVLGQHAHSFVAITRKGVWLEPRCVYSCIALNRVIKCLSQSLSWVLKGNDCVAGVRTEPQVALTG